jgi:hypothetical protein
MKKGKNAIKGKGTGNDAKDDVPPKKRGQPTDFKGQRLDFLTSRIPDYVEAVKKKGTSEGKTKGLSTFWASFFDDYWKRFPWELPFDVDPDPNAPPLPPPQTAEEAFASLGMNLTEEESARKTKIQTDTKAVRQRLFFFGWDRGLIRV